MQAFIVGADALGNIPGVLAEYGIDIGYHLTGRNPSHQRSPSHIKGMDIVILFTDFLSHNTMRNYREVAQKRNVQFVACRRSVGDLKRNLELLRVKSLALQ
ncbi:DUF2325 domain-containing protein [Chitinibacter bivalviorum]|uniref:DUF2325 domain-containing protein n=1 Tax=Chitinibacter bivalviorum TaxID=2739434 RepID=A0A7H9BMY7_9NEIS|nr:DUF2325 domain-containing protein [Chitinibacter bivalviorum]QLG89451.1 DUF2325 domain-containing protein [Chitinibacter bivalviorum]